MASPVVTGTVASRVQAFQNLQDTTINAGQTDKPPRVMTNPIDILEQGIRVGHGQRIEPQFASPASRPSRDGNEGFRRDNRPPVGNPQPSPYMFGGSWEEKEVLEKPPSRPMTRLHERPGYTHREGSYFHKFPRKYRSMEAMTRHTGQRDMYSMRSRLKSVQESYQPQVVHEWDVNRPESNVLDELESMIDDVLEQHTAVSNMKIDKDLSSTSSESISTAAPTILQTPCRPSVDRSQNTNPPCLQHRHSLQRGQRKRMVDEPNIQSHLRSPKGGPRLPKGSLETDRCSSALLLPSEQVLREVRHATSPPKHTSNAVRQRAAHFENMHFHQNRQSAHHDHEDSHSRHTAAQCSENQVSAPVQDLLNFHLSDDNAHQHLELHRSPMDITSSSKSPFRSPAHLDVLGISSSPVHRQASPQPNEYYHTAPQSGRTSSLHHDIRHSQHGNAEHIERSNHPHKQDIPMDLEEPMLGHDINHGGARDRHSHDLQDENLSCECKTAKGKCKREGREHPVHQGRFSAATDWQDHGHEDQHDYAYHPKDFHESLEHRNDRNAHSSQAHESHQHQHLQTPRRSVSKMWPFRWGAFLNDKSPPAPPKESDIVAEAEASPKLHHEDHFHQSPQHDFQQPNCQQKAATESHQSFGNGGENEHIHDHHQGDQQEPHHQGSSKSRQHNNIQRPISRIETTERTSRHEKEEQKFVKYEGEMKSEQTGRPDKQNQWGHHRAKGQRVLERMSLFEQGIENPQLTSKRKQLNRQEVQKEIQLNEIKQHHDQTASNLIGDGSLTQPQQMKEATEIKPLSTQAAEEKETTHSNSIQTESKGMQDVESYNHTGKHSVAVSPQKPPSARSSSVPSLASGMGSPSRRGRRIERQWQHEDGFSVSRGGVSVRVQISISRSPSRGAQLPENPKMDGTTEQSQNEQKIVVKADIIQEDTKEDEDVGGE